MFVRWWRLEEDDRRRVWLLYGYFSGLMCVGSVFGAVAWAVWMQFLLAYFSGFATPAPSYIVQQSCILYPVRRRFRVPEHCEAHGS